MTTNEYYNRTSVLAILAVSVLWVPVLNSMKTSQLYVYIQSVSNFLAPPVTAVFILAFFVPRTTEPVNFIFALFTNSSLYQISVNT